MALKADPGGAHRQPARESTSTRVNQHKSAVRVSLRSHPQDGVETVPPTSTRSDSDVVARTDPLPDVEANVARGNRVTD